MGRILAAYPARVSYGPDARRWRFTTPGGDRVEWTDDAAAGATDLVFALAAAPLVAAGVNPAALAADGWVHEPAAAGAPAVLTRSWDLGSATASGRGVGDGAADAFERLLAGNEGRIRYVARFQHFTLALGGDDQLEWTADLGANDADLAFILGAAPLVDAGANPVEMENAGWIYTPASGSSPAVFIRPVKLD
jgi:hypothetical protein